MFFLPVLNADDVTIKRTQDGTFYRLRGRNPPSDCKMHDIPTEEPPNSDKPPKWNTLSHPMVRQTTNYKVNWRRIHSRIVFQEVCETLNVVRDLYDVLQMLLGVRTLRLLHGVGWVHRDICHSNIMRIEGV